MSIHVFLGPTLPVAQAREILDAVYLPPVAMGDVYRLLPNRPAAIVIVDGLFDQVPSVRHKEILVALEAGVRVFGASSMGALRAAELWPFGMEGVGGIFEAFKGGELEDDDEVTVVHGAAESGHQPLSEAMVNLRDGLRRALEAGVIASETSRVLCDLAKQMFYAERSWQALGAAGAKCGLAAAELDALTAFVKRERPNLKREDAVSLLHHVRAEALGGMKPHVPTFHAERTVFWQQLTDSLEQPFTDDLRLAAEGVTYEALGNHVRAVVPHYGDIRQGQLLLHLVQREAARLGIRPSAERVKEASERFRRARGLMTARATEAWMAVNGITGAEFKHMFELEVLGDEVLAHHAYELRPLLQIELRRRGEFASLRDQVVRKKRVLRERGITNATMADAGTDFDGLMLWYQQRCGKLDGTLEQRAAALGFDSPRNFLAEVIEQFILEKSPGPAAPAPSSH
jgi:hypothetical protein